MAESRRPQVYRPDRAEGAYDAVIIGSGMGGLAVAAFLSKAGRKVLVLERHYTMGGFTHTFRRKRYEWDVGVHYVGELHQRDTLPSLLMNDISDGSLRWARMPSNYDRLIFPDRSFDLIAGREPFIDELAAAFPSERGALTRYVELTDRAAAAALRFFQHKALPPALLPVTRPFMSREFMKLAGETTAAVIGGLTDDSRLMGVLTGQWGAYGLPPAASSFGIHALIVSHYMDGAAYPVGGAGAIARSILPTIEAAGGKLLVHADVEEILTRAGVAVGVRLSDGQEIRAPLVISDAGVANTFGRLVSADVRARLGLEKKLRQVQPSTSHICLYAGLTGSADRIGLEPTNLWIYPSYDHDRNVRTFLEDPEAPLPAVYISFPSAKDPSWLERRGETATLELISFAPYEWFQPWESERWRRRGEAYEELKERFSQRLLEALYEHLPQTRGRVDYHELSTPLSTRQFSNYSQGEIYGVSPTPQRFQLKWLGPRTPVRGLYLTGQDAVAHGVVGALYAGLVTASAVLGRNVLKDIKRRAGRGPAGGLA